MGNLQRRSAISSKTDRTLFHRALFILVVLLPIYAWAADKDTPVSIADLKIIEAEGISVLGEDTTPAQAKAVALNNARRRALEEAVGVTLHGSSVLYNSELISDLVVTATKGLIVKEEVLESGFRSDKELTSYRVLVRAYIKPVRLERRGNFKITKAEVFNAANPKATIQPVFNDGDEIQIRVKVSSESYIHIFSVDQNGRVSRIFPTSYAPAERLPPETEFVFPDDTLRGSGIRLRVGAPRNTDRAIESALVIATKERVNLLSGKSEEDASITDIMRELSEMDISLWADKTVGYEVRR